MGSHNNIWIEPIGYTSSFRPVRTPVRLNYGRDDSKIKETRAPILPKLNRRRESTPRTFPMELRPREVIIPEDKFSKKSKFNRSQSTPREVLQSYNNNRRSPRKSLSAFSEQSRNRDRRPAESLKKTKYEPLPKGKDTSKNTINSQKRAPPGYLHSRPSAPLKAPPGYIHASSTTPNRASSGLRFSSPRYRQETDQRGRRGKSMVPESSFRKDLKSSGLKDERRSRKRNSSPTSFRSRYYNNDDEDTPRRFLRSHSEPPRRSARIANLKKAVEEQGVKKDEENGSRPRARSRGVSKVRGSHSASKPKTSRANYRSSSAAPSRTFTSSSQGIKNKITEKEKRDSRASSTNPRRIISLDERNSKPKHKVDESTFRSAPGRLKRSATVERYLPTVTEKEKRGSRPCNICLRRMVSPHERGNKRQHRLDESPFRYAPVKVRRSATAERSYGDPTVPMEVNRKEKSDYHRSSIIHRRIVSPDERYNKPQHRFDEFPFCSAPRPIRRSATAERNFGNPNVAIEEKEKSDYHRSNIGLRRMGLPDERNNEPLHRFDESLFRFAPRMVSRSPVTAERSRGDQDFSIEGFQQFTPGFQPMGSRDKRNNEPLHRFDESLFCSSPRMVSRSPDTAGRSHGDQNVSIEEVDSSHQEDVGNSVAEVFSRVEEKEKSDYHRSNIGLRRMGSPDERNNEPLHRFDESLFRFAPSMVSRSPDTAERSHRDRNFSIEDNLFSRREPFNQEDESKANENHGIQQFTPSFQRMGSRDERNSEPLHRFDEPLFCFSPRMVSRSPDTDTDQNVSIEEVDSSHQEDAENSVVDVVSTVEDPDDNKQVVLYQGGAPSMNHDTLFSRREPFNQEDETESEENRGIDSLIAFHRRQMDVDESSDDSSDYSPPPGFAHHGGPLWQASFNEIVSPDDRQIPAWRAALRDRLLMQNSVWNNDKLSTSTHILCPDGGVLCVNENYYPLNRSSSSNDSES